ncbi:hypothetical protein A2976_04830 [candidate division WWE3 bacterium RIFCSPLOWO2_01_FULL_41_9]|uniref:HTH HARE-type domain-containing protein n=1 Tax=candidate division WWE3 bacterium RIFCSPLOWO2_01_FULL_41_9 TaxID=1802626 RepID=A0A1F4VLL9_UNCKA|nr:MAG: hypothetical protein A2976_04830 [candidate division WWE3 bacterium RIFCSPLOWO2_01_FULL_41_9]
MAYSRMDDVVNSVLAMLTLAGPLTMAELYDELNPTKGSPHQATLDELYSATELMGKNGQTIFRRGRFELAPEKQNAS